MSSAERAERENVRLWKSYVFHEDQCWFVSTIERFFETAVGEMQGLVETVVWEYDWDTSNCLLYTSDAADEN